MINLKQITIIISIILLITAIFELDVGYWYYQLLKWGVFACSVLSGYLNYQNKKLLVTFLIIAILFNPIAPIYFSKEIWKIIDGVAAITFLIILFRHKFNQFFK